MRAWPVLALTLCLGAQQPQALAELRLAMEAMGGEARLRALQVVEVKGIGHTYLLEQSYKPGPFEANYESFTETRDFAKRRLRRDSQLMGTQYASWTAASLVATPEGGVAGSGGQNYPAQPFQVDDAAEALELSPERLLLRAAAAPDLHVEAEETLHLRPHHVLAFRRGSATVKLLLDAENHLPDAVAQHRTYRDFWRYWGDVDSLVQYDDWQLQSGLVYPMSRTETRNGLLLQSWELTAFRANPPVKEGDFALEPKLLAASQAALKGTGRSFNAEGAKELAPGLLWVPGAWNLCFVAQEDGVVLLEAPLSGPYVKGALEEAAKRFPELPLKAVVSSSDSWPHHGGLRQAVAAGLPVYALDLNRPLLERILAAPWTLEPDALARAPKAPQWRLVSGRAELGSGPNRMLLIPLRGQDTERQMLVYFPERKLLYASDTLASKEDGSLYDPELTHEVAQAVARERLEVETVFAMHQGPTSWAKLLAQIEAASR